MSRFTIILAVLLQGVFPGAKCLCAPAHRADRARAACCHEQKAEPVRCPCCAKNSARPAPTSDDRGQDESCPCISAPGSQPLALPIPGLDRQDHPPIAWIDMSVAGNLHAALIPVDPNTEADRTCPTHQRRQAQLAVWLN